MEGRDNRRWWTLAAVSIGIFMLLLDITVVNVALPDIQRDLGSSFSDLQWVVDAYALTLAAVLLTAGSLADLMGRRLLFTIGLAVFICASLTCGLSQSPLMLNLARGAQGIGGAIMYATSLALIAHAFRGPERGTAFGVYGAVTGASVAVGPLIGGAITQGIGWRWIFFVNVPIGIAAILLTLRRVEESRDEEAARIDLPGVASFSGALFLLVFALVRGNIEGWGSPMIVGFLAGAGALLVAFLVWELHTREPMFELSLFRKPAFSGAALIAFTLSASAFSMFLYQTLYLQNILGYSPLAAGVRFLPSTLLSFVAAPVAGKLSARLPVRVLMGVGMALVAAGLLVQGLLVTAESGWTVLLPGFILLGAGIGMVNPPLASTQIGVVEPRRSGMASGIGNTFRQVGIATGIAALGAIFQHLVTTKTIGAASASGLPIGHAHQLKNALSSGQIGKIVEQVPPSHRAAAVHAIRVGFTGSLDDILFVSAGVAVAGAVAAFGMVRRRDFVASGQLTEAPAAAVA